MATIPTLANYNINPATQGGSGSAYGAVPGALDLPPSIYSQVGDVLPNLSKLTGQAGQLIGSELAGQLPSGTIGQIQDASAAFGVRSGMPGSGFQANQGLESLGISALQLQQSGLKDYQNILASLGQTQLNPSLITDITARNAMMGAAPDPEAAATKLTDLASGGTGGSRISISGPTNSSIGTIPGLGSPGGAFQNVGTVGTWGAPIASGTPAGYPATATGNPYQDDTWLYGPGGGPGADQTPATSTGTASGFDSSFYDNLLGDNLDPLGDNLDPLGFLTGTSYLQ